MLPCQPHHESQLLAGAHIAMILSAPAAHVRTRMWPPARVAELADAMDSKSIARKGVRVRIPPRALTIRAATQADARAIAEVHIASWRAGYRGLIPDDVLAALSLEDRTAQWETILQDERTTVLVADDVAGFIAFEHDTREIRALYVDPARFRTGVGTALLNAAHERLEGDSALWVLEGNDGAMAFYRRHGYEADGARALHEPSRVDQLRMTRRAPE
jgi:GNAT superfamily N-acetyltransferase